MPAHSRLLTMIPVVLNPVKSLLESILHSDNYVWCFGGGRVFWERLPSSFLQAHFEVNEHNSRALCEALKSDQWATPKRTGEFFKTTLLTSQPAGVLCVPC